MLDPKEEKVDGDVNEDGKTSTSESQNSETQEIEKEPETPKVEVEISAEGGRISEPIQEEPAVTEPEQDQAEKAVEEVEGKIAEEAEKDEQPTIPVKDYDKMELEELADELEKLIKNNPIQQIKNHAESIKSSFNIKFGKLLAEKKEAFLAEGGNSIDFQFSSPVKTRYNKLLSDYKKQRDSYYSTLEKQLKENLEKRFQVIDDLKALIQEADTKTMYRSFRELQNVWKSIGAVPKNKYNDTWRTYHHHVERFYDLLHLSNDFRDLDFKNNLEEKLKIIQRAEELSEKKM